MNNATAATMPSAPSSSMTLLIEPGPGYQRVLFAEAGKDVVDFILGLVAMPLGAVDRLLFPEGGSLGSIGNVYASAEEMDAAYMQSITARDALLVATFPVVPAPPSFTPRRPPVSSSLIFGTPPHGLTTAPSVSLYGGGRPPCPPPSPPHTSSNIRPSGTNHALQPLLPLYMSRCDACHASRLPRGSRGFVTDMAKYTIMDDLTVTPTTNVSSVALLKSLGVSDVYALEERTVNVGREEAMDILKAALRSKTVLTDVFLKSKLGEMGKVGLSATTIPQNHASLGSWD